LGEGQPILAPSISISCIIDGAKHHIALGFSVKHTEVIDWRVWRAATVVVAPPGGIARPGDQVYVTTRVSDSLLGALAFVTPSPTALSLSAGIDAAHRAKAALMEMKRLPLEGSQHVRSVSAAALPLLYSYFEQSMAAVVSSFQALESFANQIIAEGLQGTLEIKRTSGLAQWSASEIEENCSTEEKLGAIVGRIRGIKSPRGTKPWQGFKTLKSLRDAATHLKSRDQYVRGAPDRQTLYFKLLNNEPTDYPRWSLSMLRYFSDKSSRWLDGAEAVLAERQRHE